MPAVSLYQLARKACVRNINSIQDIGDIPYELIRPVLIKLENPAQLRSIEENSPQICGHDAEIWMEFIKRDVPQWESKLHEPKNPKNWYKVYKKLRDESQAEVEKDAEMLKAAFDGLKSEKAKHTSRVVDPSSVPRLPRDRGMRVEGGRAKGPGTVRTGNQSLLSFGTGSRTKTNTGKSVMEKARREAREMSLFSVRKSVLATPTHRLSDKATQVRHVPRGMLDEHRRPTTPRYNDPSTASDAKPAMIYAPRRGSVARSGASAGGTGMTSEERERRLRAVAQGKPIESSGPPSGSVISASNVKPSSALGNTTRPSDSRPTFPSSAYKAPPIRPPPRPQGEPIERKRPSVNPFMPAKKRRPA
ncbi:hypothetical protein L228DRAFT_281593 [Xylona heveae TC161]|uniref:RNA polymerase II transcription factor SIII subunit A n=1 Tax=Xylona heveae (strain CBS 132557 / TC161) TaxID=1328760 RepID=A0A165I8A7_XYLHT|nr:hypothetical protein L228DRAFT_281593 [Xylona heveae TC161]KZF24529.1 hypothetical protein L228DRAFT_281593 [Xylona heveae TC161]